MRSSRSGNSRIGNGAPIASGLKKLRGSFIGRSSPTQDIRSSKNQAGQADDKARLKRKTSPSRF
jgi:hypothetical protein